MHTQFENDMSHSVGTETHENAELEHKDFTVNPSDIRDVQFYRYRKYGIPRLVEYIRVVLPDGQETLLFGTTEKNQFVSRMGLKISELRRIYDYNERNDLILKACKSRKEPVIMRSFKDDGSWKTYAVVTEVFTHVGHQELWKIVQEQVEAMNFHIADMSEFRTTKRVWKTYIFENKVGFNIGDVVQVGIRVANSVKATSSIIFYPFWKRLVCSNGMTSCDGFWKPATTHKGQKIDILKSVRLTLKDALDEAFGIEKLMVRAMKIKMPKGQMLEVLDTIVKRKRLSQYSEFYMKRYIENDLKSENLWEFVNAMTYTSTHNDMSESVKLKIEQTAFRLLKDGEKGVRALLSPASVGGE